MFLSEILSSETKRRQEFPVVENQIFLAHAAVSALPRRISERIQSFAQKCSVGDQEEMFNEKIFAETRSMAARLIGATPEEIALVGPTSNALSYVAAGLPWRKNDNVVVYLDDYPSNVYPWMALSSRGVEIRYITPSQLGQIRWIDVLSQIDENTRIVSLASCHFISGYRIDYEQIGQKLHERGILFCLDAIQTLGAMPTHVDHIDFLAADAHKWLLGPCAAGILYVKRDLQDVLKPYVFGWHNVHCPNFVTQETMKQPRDARRYEAGSANLLGLTGMHAALDLIHEVGIDAISSRILELRDFLCEHLQIKGYQVLNNNTDPSNTSGIISFMSSSIDMSALYQKLAQSQIVTSLRTDRSGQRWIRLSPHFYNTREELMKLMECL